MFRDDYEAMENAGVGKVGLLEKNLFAYVISAMLAGAFIGIGVLLMSTVGAYAAGTPYVKLAMGVVFSVGLSLVVLVGAELFTGNNLVPLSSAMSGKITYGKMLKLWVICFLGNWIGSILVASIFVGTGLATGEVGAFMVAASANKMSIPVVALICRGIFCNFLVCLAVWSGFRCKTEVGKLIMIMWCITAFVACGFEHCVANMTMLTVGMLKAGSLGLPGVTIGGYFYNIFVAAIGNIIGGALCVAVPYHIISREK